jgi:hypothetical protein|nr:DUF5670 family protein [Kofleriaceae bacterium]
MLLAIALILGILWFFGFVIFHVTAAGIHFLLVLGVIALVVHLVRGGSSRPLVP